MDLKKLKMLDTLLTLLCTCVGCVGIVLLLKYLMGILALFIFHIDDTLILICSLFLDGVLLLSLIEIGVRVQERIRIKEYQDRKR